MRQAFIFMDLFEILLPIIVIVVYFLSSVFKGGNKEGEVPDQPGPPPLSQEERDIQEEIRRKIQERSEQQPQPQEEETPRYDPLKSEHEQRTRRVREQVKEMREDPRSLTPDVEAAPPPLEPALTTRQTSSIEERMRKQREEISAMERRAEEVRSQAQQRLQSLSNRGPSDPYAKARPLPYQLRTSGRGEFSSELIASLKDPREFKKAILAYEILGTPVGQRRENKMGPIWEQ